MSEEKESPLDRQQSLAESLEARKRAIIEKYQAQWREAERAWRLKKRHDRRDPTVDGDEKDHE
jgi:hypothetical protein